MSDWGNITFVTPPVSVGSIGANVGIYYPTGLIALATRINRAWPNRASVVDLTAGAPKERILGDIVCISISSSLVYPECIRLAVEFKSAGKTVILGGPYVTEMYKQIAAYRSNAFDFLIRGKGEQTVVRLLQAMGNAIQYPLVPGLSYKNEKNEVIHTPEDNAPYDWSESTPLDLSVLDPPIESYWRNYSQRIDPTVDYEFQVFTHFGCRYRENKIRSGGVGNQSEFQYCSFCGLKDAIQLRTPESIVSEMKHYLEQYRVLKNSSVSFKCYGDNAAAEVDLLEKLASYPPMQELYRQFDIGWIFYVQSLYASERLFKALKQLNTRIIYVGFDAVNDDVQRRNRLGTTQQSHRRTAWLAKQFNIKIQAGFVLGLAGETRETLDEMVSFAQELASQGVLERIIPSMAFMIPGSQAYQALVRQFPYLDESDYIPYPVLQKYWFDSFTGLGPNAHEILSEYARKLGELSPDKGKNIIGTMGWPKPPLKATDKV